MQIRVSRLGRKLKWRPASTTGVSLWVLAASSCTRTHSLTLCFLLISLSDLSACRDRLLPDILVAIVSMQRKMPCMCE